MNVQAIGVALGYLTIIVVAIYYAYRFGYYRGYKIAFKDVEAKIKSVKGSTPNKKKRQAFMEANKD